MSAPEHETWCMDDLPDSTPGDYLIGCIEGRWIGDEESQGNAIVAFLAALFSKAGLEPEVAVDKAIDYAERGVKVKWDGSSLGFEFEDDTPEPATGQGEAS